MTEHILRMSNRWEDNGTIDVHKEFMQLTLAIVCKLLFNFDIESEAKEIGKHVTTLVEYFNRARMPLVQVIEKSPLPSNRRFRYAKAQLNNRRQQQMSLRLSTMQERSRTNDYRRNRSYSS